MDGCSACTLCLCWEGNPHDYDGGDGLSACTSCPRWEEALVFTTEVTGALREHVACVGREKPVFSTDETGRRRQMPCTRFRCKEGNPRVYDGGDWCSACIRCLWCEGTLCVYDVVDGCSACTSCLRWEGNTRVYEGCDWYSLCNPCPRWEGNPRVYDGYDLCSACTRLPRLEDNPHVYDEGDRCSPWKRFPHWQEFPIFTTVATCTLRAPIACFGRKTPCLRRRQRVHIVHPLFTLGEKSRVYDRGDGCTACTPCPQWEENQVFTTEATGTLRAPVARVGEKRVSDGGDG
ncbi:hypothetical protein CHS0354_028825 [Potamilus streckersoni]|uniref:Uncharacterized protein n=1 Tax=Potamilus streckersoni TaxID=2493646 RepID=A0AAE0VKP0_9BIVA|nr:hypothetical protein CHS0354_028825 [Potamilus streckersoni]